MPNNCPACGYQLEVIERTAAVGNLTVSLYGDCEWQGRRVRLTQGELVIVYTLASNPGLWIKSDALLNLFSTSENPNVVSVMVHRIRRKFREADPAFDRIEVSTRGQSGYRWRVK